jgi:hypothetical protein
LRVQGQQRSAKEENHREAQEEKNALKIPLPSVAENDDNPEEREERPSRQHNEP